MAIFTPRGLKIRMSIAESFALMARLYPKVSAFKILKTTEGLESIPSMFAFIASLVCFAFKLNPFLIGGYVLGASILGFLMTFFGFYGIPGIPFLGKMFSYISGFGIFVVISAVVGFFLVGWRGVVAMVVAVVVSSLIQLVIDRLYSRAIFKKTGLWLTSSERHFFNACRLHATRLGIFEEFEEPLREEEFREENWMPVYMDLATKWPRVVRRFTPW